MSDSLPTVGKIVANFLMNDLKGMLAKKKIPIADSPVSPEALGFLAKCVHEGALTKRQMKDLVKKWVDEA